MTSLACDLAASAAFNVEATCTIVDASTAGLGFALTGTLSVVAAKTDAGVRVVDLTAALWEELRQWWHTSRHAVICPNRLVVGALLATGHVVTGAPVV